MTSSPFALVKSDEGFERSWNVLQISIEIVVALIVVAGLVGAFGGGYLSGATKASRDGRVRITYDRIVRRTVSTKLVISLLAPAGREAEVTVPKTFLDGMQIVSVLPRATVTRAEADGALTYVFALGAAGTGDITISAKPEGFGATASPMIVDGTGIALSQFIFP